MAQLERKRKPSWYRMSDFRDILPVTATSKSEIVLPAFKNDTVALVLDIDSDQLNGFCIGCPATGAGDAVGLKIPLSIHRMLGIACIKLLPLPKPSQLVGKFFKLADKLELEASQLRCREICFQNYWIAPEVPTRARNNPSAFGSGPTKGSGVSGPFLTEPLFGFMKISPAFYRTSTVKISWDFCGMERSPTNTRKNGQAFPLPGPSTVISHNLFQAGTGSHPCSLLKTHRPN